MSGWKKYIYREVSGRGINFIDLSNYGVYYSKGYKYWVVYQWENG